MIRAIVYGVGSIGSMIAKYALERNIQIVGAIDNDPQKIGKDLGEILNLGKLNVEITSNVEKLLSKVDAQLAFHSTKSYIKDVLPQLEILVDNGLSIISTCEELAYPKIHPELTKIDEKARDMNITVLGAGVNPGFIMDAFPLTLTTACMKVSQIRVLRVIDATDRRRAFQLKIGVSMKPEEFQDKIKHGAITGHVGLRESAYLLAEGSGLKLTRVELSDVKPVLAEEKLKTPYFTVESGMVCGLRQEAVGWMDNKPAVKLTFEAYVGAKNPRDEIWIEGKPNFHLIMDGGVPGDTATAAIIVNLARIVLKAKRGVISILDLYPSFA